MLVFRPAHAEKPLAVCKDGVCTMSEKDLVQLREFIAKTRDAAKENEERQDKMSDDLMELLGALSTCKAKLGKHKT